MARNSIQSKTLTWIDIQNPTREDIGYLTENFKFHPLVLDELIPPGHRPKVEYYDDYLFMIISYPALNKETGVIEKKELDILVSKGYLITNHYEPIMPVKLLFDEAERNMESREKLMGKTTGHLLHTLIAKTIKISFGEIEEIEDHINRIEEQIFKGHERKMVLEISVTRRRIIDVRRILAPQKEIYDSLAEVGKEFWGEALAPYFEDILGIYGNVWNTVEEQRETMQALGDTNISLLSTKTGETTKLLTVMATITLPLTFIASIWGMNTDTLPFSGLPQGFFVVL